MSPFSYSDFNKILSNLHMNSTYKGVFLYTLTDLADYDDERLVGKQWVHHDDDFWLVDFEFSAVRFLRYYWLMSHHNIYHMSKGQASSDPQNDTLNIFKIIREQPDVEQTPDLAHLTKNSELCKQIIKEAMKKEMLHHIKDDFRGLIDVKEKKLKLNTELVDVIRENRDRIRKDIQIKISDHLHRLSENEGVIPHADVDMGPFSVYFSEVKEKVFLVCVDGDEAKNLYKQTMNDGIQLIPEELSGKNVLLWAIRSTDDNTKIWKEIHSGDIVLFVNDGRCFTKAKVRTTVRGTRTAKQLWPEHTHPPRDLMITFESIQLFDLDLKDPIMPLINPIVSNQYNFPITKAALQLRRDLQTMCDIHMFNSSEQLTKVDVGFIQTQTKARRGQQKFRDMVLENYHNKCAVCDMDDKGLLEAAHILPVGHVATAGDLDNGLCLCVLHHRMFDMKYLYFDDEYRAHLTDKAPKFIRDSWQSVTIDESSCVRMPSKKYLYTHRESCEKWNTNYGNKVFQ